MCITDGDTICLKKLLFQNSEMFEAQRWNTDPKYFSPMAILNSSHIFVGDIVCLKGGQTLAKVIKFTTEVGIKLISTVK